MKEGTLVTVPTPESAAPTPGDVAQSLQRAFGLTEALTHEVDDLGTEIKASREKLDDAAKVVEKTNKLIRRRNWFLVITIASVCLDIILTLGLGWTALDTHNLQASTRTTLYNNCVTGQKRTNAELAMIANLLKADQLAYKTLSTFPLKPQPGESTSQFAASEATWKEFYAQVFSGPIAAYQHFEKVTPPVPGNQCAKYR
jgi:hypothetical protein